MKNKKEIIGWALYDWANSGYANIMAALFPIFFAKYWCTIADDTLRTVRLGVGNAAAGIILVLTAPLLGAIADNSSSKKKFLYFFAFIGIVMCCSFYLISKDQWFAATVIYVLSTVGFTGANTFYDALIKNVTEEENYDKVSSFGYGIGYLGGGIIFAINAWMISSPQTFGFPDEVVALKYSFVAVGVWWAIFSIPLMLFVKEPENPNAKTGMDKIKGGVSQLLTTFREIKQLKTVFLFLFAYWFYIDGVDTIIRMSANYGISIGFADSDLILALLITQFIGFPSAIAYGYFGNRIGTKNAIFVAIGVYLIITVLATFMDKVIHFYLLACMVGLVQGGIQALSRSFYARIIPQGKTAEFFGFYNMLGKFAAVFGPLLIAFFAYSVRAIGFGDEIATRASITSVSILFILGGVFLYFVDENKGMEEK